MSSKQKQRTVQVNYLATGSNKQILVEHIKIWRIRHKTPDVRHQTYITSESIFLPV